MNYEKNGAPIMNFNFYIDTIIKMLFIVQEAVV